MSQMGWIKIHRGMINWEWFSSPKHLSVFLDLLLNANHKDKKYRGKLVKKGQLTTSYNAISLRTGVSVRGVRTVLRDLKATQEITHEATRHCSVISITKWDSYQLDDKQNDNLNDKLTTDRRQPNDNLTTTNKNVNNVKNEKNVEKKCKAPTISNDLFDNVINTWNNILAGKNNFKYVRGLKSQTKEKFFAIVELNSEFKNVESWTECFNNVKNIDTYNGNNPHSFVASLVWLIDTEKIVDVLNGQFGGNNGTSNKSTLEEFGQLYKNQGIQ